MTPTGWRRSTAPRSCSSPSCAPGRAELGHLRHQRVHRTAPRRLRRGRADGGARGRALPRRADPDVRRHPGRPRLGAHHQLRRRGGGHHPRRCPRGGLPVVISFTVETDGRLPSGTTHRGRDPPGRRRHRPRARLLHDQLRAPHPLQRRPARGPALAVAPARHPRQRVAAQPRRARRRHHARRRRSRGARRRVPAAGHGAAPAHHPRRLLRDRSPPRRRPSPRCAPDLFEPVRVARSA